MLYPSCDEFRFTTGVSDVTDVSGERAQQQLPLWFLRSPVHLVKLADLWPPAA